jgi:hypothetical protein
MLKAEASRISGALLQDVVHPHGPTLLLHRLGNADASIRLLGQQQAMLEVPQMIDSEGRGVGLGAPHNTPPPPLLNSTQDMHFSPEPYQKKKMRGQSSEYNSPTNFKGGNAVFPQGYMRPGELVRKLHGMAKVRSEPFLS